ncbi:hypothetical protein PHJA_000091900 [Phtheirospermum japonicum]|uniref:Stress-response A/B barrel domain-containing protein n=1 Tax=Phtheirospermum japonicum TaxID=374723 RepID=A0A830B4M4_9LAMI|nr:hypothetical protein PHJA_000091900 [Phtheirospermum japonicum]
MLLSLRTAARTHLPSTILHRRPSAAAPIRKPSIVSHFRFNLRSSPSSIRMSSSDSHSNPSANQIIEHFVLFKVKPDADPSAVDAMIANINGLISLQMVIHLAAGPVSGCRSNSLTFTHMLHSRYRSKADLATYKDHPAHVNVVSNYVKLIIDDIMAVDWVVDDFPGPAVVSPGSAVRLTVLKVKEGAGESEVVKVLRGIKEKFPSIEQLTVGDNFSPETAKGFSICSIAVLKGMKELEELDAETETEVRELVDGVLVLDYTVPVTVTVTVTA